MSAFQNLEQRIAAFQKADLYPVISPEFTNGRAMFEVFQAVVEGGARIVQIREKHASKRDLYDLVTACVPIARKYGVLLIVDDHVDVALAAQADGCHVGQDDLPVTAARKIAPELLIGCSTHNQEEALQAKADGAGYINIGPIYPTATKEVACGALGVKAIGRIAPLVNMPFSVMGGIKARHLPELIAAGARHIAMVTEVSQAPDITAAVRNLRRAMGK